MQMKRKNNFICFFLALAMILSGMCFDYAKADSLLAYEYSNEITSTLDASDSLSENPDIRTEEISGSRLVSNSIKSERRGEEKASYRTDVCLSSVNIFAQDSTMLFTTVASELHNNIHSNTVIINYIHQQDGKKA